MSTRIQRRGGTVAEHATFVGAPREITVDTSEWRGVIHDGVTPGGHPVAKVADVEAAIGAATNAYPASRTVLKGYDTSAIMNAYLAEPGREGLFVWTLGDFSAQVTADTQEVVYVKATAVSAAVGAWVRRHDGVIEASWAGVAVDDGSGTNYMHTALNAALTAAGAGATVVVKAGNYNVGGVISVPALTTLYLRSGVVLTSRAANISGRIVNLAGDGAHIKSDGGPRRGVGAAILDCMGTANSGVTVTELALVTIEGLYILNPLGRGINVVRSTQYTIRNNFVFWTSVGVAAKVAAIAAGGTTFLAGIWCASHEGAVSGNWSSQDPVIIDNHVNALAFNNNNIPYFAGIGVRGDEIGVGIMQRLVLQRNCVELGQYTQADYATNPYYPAARAGCCEIRSGIISADISNNDMAGGDIVLSVGLINESIVSNNRLHGGAHYTLELVTIANCMIDSNLIYSGTSWYGISYNNCNDTIVSGNMIRAGDGTIADAGAIVTSGTIQRGQIVGNNILADKENVAGIRVYEGTNMQISGNTIRCVTATLSYPIEVAASITNVLVTGNFIQGGTNAFRVRGGATITNLLAAGNQGSGTGAYSLSGAVTNAAVAGNGNQGIGGWS